MSTDYDKIAQGVRSQNNFDKLAEQITGTVTVEEGMPLGMPPTPMQSIERGIKDIYQGVPQMYYEATDPQKAQQYTAEKTAEIKAYEERRPKGSGMDWWRLAGQSAYTLPLMGFGGGVTTGARALYGALEGGAMSGVQFMPEDKSRIEQTLIGAGTGAVATPIVDFMGRLAKESWQGLSSFFQRKGKQIENLIKSPEQLAIDVDNAFATQNIDLAALPQNLQQTVLQRSGEMLATTGKLEPNAVLRQAKFDLYGFGDESAPLPSQLTRDPMQYREEQYLSQQAGGEGIIQRELAQIQRMRQAGEELEGMVTTDGMTRIEVDEKITETLSDRWKDEGKRVSELYDIAANAEGADLPFPIDNIRPQLQDYISINEDVIPPKMLKRLEDIATGEVQLTVREMNNLRKRINASMSKSNDGTVRHAGGELKGILDNADIEGDYPAIEAYKVATAEAKQRFGEFGVGAKRKSQLEKIANNSFVVDDWVYKNVVNNNHRDILKIKKSAEAQDPTIWGDVKGSIVNRIWDEATARGEDKFSHHVFKKHIRALEKGGKLNAIFTPKEVTMLRDLVKISEWAFTAPQGAIKGSQTAPLLLDVLQKIDQFPAVGTIGAVVLRPAIKKVQSDLQQKRISNLLDGKTKAIYQQIVSKVEKNELPQYPTISKLGQGTINFMRQYPSAMGVTAYETMEQE